MGNHHCSSLVFRCMDFRITPMALSALLAAEGYCEGDYDLMSLAGSAKSCLSEVREEAALVLRQVALSKKLHGIREVVVTHHENCGAYGIPDLVAERRAQTADLALIAKVVREQFPELAITAYLINGVLEGQLRLEKV